MSPFERDVLRYFASILFTLRVLTITVLGVLGAAAIVVLTH
jgi:hypothetical protein